MGQVFRDGADTTEQAAEAVHGVPDGSVTRRAVVDSHAAADGDAVPTRWVKVRPSHDRPVPTARTAMPTARPTVLTVVATVVTTAV